MRAWTLGILMVVGLAMPVHADAKPRDTVIAEAQVQPGADLNQILEANGWTVLALPSNMHLPGKLFKPGASSAQGTCVDATPVTGDLPSIEAQGSKGFVVEAGVSKGPVGGSGSVQATSFKLKSTTGISYYGYYGMQWWTYGELFAAVGYHGQLVYVHPEQDMVVARFGTYTHEGSGFERVGYAYHDTVDYGTFDQSTFATLFLDAIIDD
jgi:hypothetical protein